MKKENLLCSFLMLSLCAGCTSAPAEAETGPEPETEVQEPSASSSSNQNSEEPDNTSDSEEPDNTTDSEESAETSEESRTITYSSNGTTMVQTNPDGTTITYTTDPWPESALADQIPVFDSEYLQITQVDDDILTIQIPQADFSDFEMYVQRAKDYGYINETEESPSWYSAINHENYLIDIIYVSGKNYMTITVSPVELSLENNENYTIANTD